MNAVDHSSFSVTITSAMLEGFQRERKNAQALLDQLVQKISDLDEKIHAITVLAPGLAKASGASVEPRSLIEQIVDVVNANRERKLTPKDIRTILIEQGAMEDGEIPPYFYTALKRATDKGKIDKVDGTYMAPPSIQQWIDDKESMGA
jgi:hypothetical protein